MPKKQQELAGVGQPSIKELDDASEEYVKIRDARMAFTKREVEARQKVADLMKIIHSFFTIVIATSQRRGKTIFVPRNL